MEKMNLFDKKFVYFMWEDELEGKEVFTADDMESLIEAVNNNGSKHRVTHTRSNSNSSEYNLRYPFRTNSMTVCQFVYYDPNCNVKKAYVEGKHIQYKFSDKNETEWHDLNDVDKILIEEKGLIWFDDGCDYRIKPTKFIVYSDCPSHYFINSEDETIDNKWEKMFEGTEKECEEWLQNRLEEDNTFESANLYKKYCENCKHSSLDGRCYPCNDCYDGSRVDNKIHIPYENTNEFIKDYCDRFKVATLNHRLPTIWIKSKETSECCLIIKYSKDKVYTDVWIDLKTLLDEFTFVDNTVIGKVEE